MALYRVKQFYWSVTSKIDEKDMQLIKCYLDPLELELFHKLATYEKKHCVNVARDVLKENINNNKENSKLVKVALLHDIGKIKKKLNPIQKSILVILDSISNGKIKKYKRIKNIDVYYNHANSGYNLLKKQKKYDERFLYLIKNHHNDNIIGDKELDIIKRCDSKN